MPQGPVCNSRPVNLRRGFAGSQRRFECGPRECSPVTPVERTCGMVPGASAESNAPLAPSPLPAASAVERHPGGEGWVRGYFVIAQRLNRIRRLRCATPRRSAAEPRDHLPGTHASHEAPHPGPLPEYRGEGVGGKKRAADGGRPLRCRGFVVVRFASPEVRVRRRVAVDCYQSARRHARARCAGRGFGNSPGTGSYCGPIGLAAPAGFFSAGPKPLAAVVALCSSPVGGGGGVLRGGVRFGVWPFVTLATFAATDPTGPPASPARSALSLCPQSRRARLTRALSRGPHTGPAGRLS